MPPLRIGLLLLLLLQGCLAVEVNEPMQQEPDEEEPALSVLLCCKHGEDLERPRNGQLDCVPSKERFQPGIYSPSRSIFLENPPVSWSWPPNSRPSCSNANESLRYVAVNRFNPYFLVDYDASVILNGGSGPNVKAGDYCLGITGLLACMAQNESQHAAATMRPKLKKCCGENAAYVPGAKSCVMIEGESVTSLEDEKPLLLGEHTANGNTSLPMEMTTGFPECPNNLTIVGMVDNAKLQPNGSINMNEKNIPTDKFCIERVRPAGEMPLIAQIIACSEHATEITITSDIRFTLYPVGFIISAIFLAATLAAGCLLPASHHVLHWRCQTHHVACLMLGDISMAVIQLAGKSLQGEWCRFIAIMAHFFFLATFFWLNTMCFNIWWTFRDLRPASLEKGQELMRLRLYCAYAWGGPLIAAGLAAFLDHLPYAPGQTFLRPRFGEKQCWFYGDMEILAYFFGPIGVLLVINLLFFAATARELTCGLWKGEFVKSTTERSRAIPRTSESARDRHRRRAALGKVCLKLVVVMGVPWIFDVISWLAGGPAFLWYVTDLLNAAQGVLIFIVVGCQPQVRAALKRFCLRNPRANGNRQGNGLSTTSHGMPSMGDSVTQNPSTKTVPLETIC